MMGIPCPSAGLEQKLSVCNRRKSLFMCYSSTQCRPDSYLVGISAAELDLIFTSLLYGISAATGKPFPSINCLSAAKLVVVLVLSGCAAVKCFS